MRYHNYTLLTKVDLISAAKGFLLHIEELQGRAEGESHRVDVKKGGLSEATTVVTLFKKKITSTEGIDFKLVKI